MAGTTSVSDTIARQLLTLRGQRAILDATLAELYGVSTRRLNEQVRRNQRRFPADFVFELAPDEFTALKSQSATSSWGGRRKLRALEKSLMTLDLNTRRQFDEVYAAIHALRALPVPKRRPIGFTRDPEEDT